MRLLTTAVVAFAVLLIGIAAVGENNLALANPAAVVSEPKAPLKDLTTEVDLSRWLSYYYVYPQPDLTLKALDLIQKSKLAKSNVRNSLVAFFSQIMAQNPKQLPAWTEKFKTMDDSMKGMLWTAMWQADTPESNKQLAIFTKSLKPEQQKLTSKMPKATPIDKMPIDGPAALDRLWACFCATGNELYVKRVISVLVPPNTHGAKNVPPNVASDMMRAGAAKWSLASNARQHKKVMAVCQKLRQETTDAALKKELTAVIDKAQAANKTVAKTK